MSTVKVIKSQKTGKVLNISTNNPLEGWIMVESTSIEYVGGRRFENKRNGFLRQELFILQNLPLDKEFKTLSAKGIDVEGLAVLAPKGFVEGQLLPGRVVIQDQLTPIQIANPKKGTETNYVYGLRVPQVGKTEEIRTAVRNASLDAGLSYMQSGMPIYRRTFYSPYPEGHPKAEQDIILSPDNIEQVNTFINTVTANIATPTASSRLDVLKAIPKANRTPAEKEELAELLELETA